MKNGFVSMRFATVLGEIHLWHRAGGSREPVFFLHGVYHDSSMWQKLTEGLDDHPLYLIDMPFHGQSIKVLHRWTLDDCASMLIELVRATSKGKVYAIGQSWGSMTILRAAARKPELFAGLGLANMPLQAGTPGRRLLFGLRHTIMWLRTIYATLAAKSLYSAKSLEADPELMPNMVKSMNTLTMRQIRKVDAWVVAGSDDGYGFVEKLQVPALALKGREDYVPQVPSIDTTLVPGGHVSPLEAPKQFRSWMEQVLAQ